MTPGATDTATDIAAAPATARSAGTCGAAWRVAAASALIAVLAGCAKPQDVVPEIVVADSALVGVLADLHVLDARRALVGDDSARAAAVRDSVLTAAGTDAERLRIRLDALTARPDLLALTWASVQDSVDARLRRLDTPAQTP